MEGLGNSGRVLFEAEGASYIVSRALANDYLVNVYRASLPA